jgi:CspA family cold shock protein
MTGKVVKKMEDKGFGFIKGDNGKEFFFHMTDLKNTRFDVLAIGQEVTFEDNESQKGLRANDIFV